MKDQEDAEEAHSLLTNILESLMQSRKKTNSTHQVDFDNQTTSSLCDW